MRKRGGAEWELVRRWAEARAQGRPASCCRLVQGAKSSSETKANQSLGQRRPFSLRGFRLAPTRAIAEGSDQRARYYCRNERETRG